MSGIDELHRVARAERAVEDAEVGDDAPEGVEYRVEDQRLQGSVLVAFGCGNALHDGFEDLFHALTRAARGGDDFVVVASQQVDDLVLDLLDHGRFHVDFVDHRDDLQVVPEGEVEVRDGLCLNALCGVDDEQGSFARGDGSRNFVGEVHVTGGVDQVEDILLSAALVFHLDGVALDRDALFAFQFHVVEYLRLQFALGYGVGRFQEAVGEGALAVVDVGYDTEISDVLHGSD